MPISKNFIFTVVGAVVLLSAAFIGFRYYNGGSNSSTEVVKTQSAEGTGSAAVTGTSLKNVEDIVRELDIIRTLKLPDTSFFQDQLFLSLKEIRVDIPPADPVRITFSLTQQRGSQSNRPAPSPSPAAR